MAVIEAVGAASAGGLSLSSSLRITHLLGCRYCVANWYVTRSKQKIVNKRSLGVIFETQTKVFVWDQRSKLMFLVYKARLAQSIISVVDADAALAIKLSMRWRGKAEGVQVSRHGLHRLDHSTGLVCGCSFHGQLWFPKKKIFS